MTLAALFISSDPKRTGRSTAVETVLVNAANVCLGIGSSILLARLLGVSGRGELAAAMLWPVLLVFFGNMGLVQSVVYFTALPGSRRNEVLGNALVLSIAQTAIL